jgi:hypothetical protein
MIVAKKLVELFSHQHAINKYIKSLDNELQTRTVMVFLACAIRESECKSSFSFYTMPQVIDLCDRMDWLSSKDNQYPVYREHKKLLALGFIDRLTKKQEYKGQQFCVTIYGRTQLRRLYNYLIRDLYTPLQ